MSDNKYIKEDGTIDVDAIYMDAKRIADPGASNPTAVANSLMKASAAMTRLMGTDGAREHPALRVMAGQLAVLFDVDRLGAEISDYDKVDEYVKKITQPDKEKS